MTRILAGLLLMMTCALPVSAEQERQKLTTTTTAVQDDIEIDPTGGLARTYETTLGGDATPGVPFTVRDDIGNHANDCTYKLKVKSSSGSVPVPVDSVLMTTSHPVSGPNTVLLRQITVDGKDKISIRVWSNSKDVVLEDTGEKCDHTLTYGAGGCLGVGLPPEFWGDVRSVKVNNVSKKVYRIILDHYGDRSCE